MTGLYPSQCARHNTRELLMHLACAQAVYPRQAACAALLAALPESIGD